MSEPHLTSLELAAQGDWHGAHELIQEFSDPLACLIHGYLHREEGDLGNANYWYSRAGQTMPDNSLSDEHERLKILATRV